MAGWILLGWPVSICMQLTLGMMEQMEGAPPSKL